MNKEKSAKTYKKSSVLKKIGFILLFVILLPFLLIGLIIRAIIRKKQRKKSENMALKGKALLIKTTINDIDKMNDYELESYLKTLFFYDDYKVTEIDYKKDNIFFVNRYNTDYVVAFKRVKKSFNIDKLINLRRVIKKQKVKQAIIVTNGVADNFVKSVISNEELLIDREKLEQKISEVYAKISLTTKKEDLIDKFDKNIQDKFPNMI